jgi:hypothetical protein
MRQAAQVGLKGGSSGSGLKIEQIVAKFAVTEKLYKEVVLS